MENATALTVADAAERLGVSERTVWRYLRSGRLSGETVGEIGSQRTLIDPASVDILSVGRQLGDGAAVVRAEMDRMAAELEALRIERDALAARLVDVPRALTRRRRRRRIAPSRASDWLLVALSRL